MAEQKKPAKTKHRKNRLEAFSDGVFAIAITLLVLEIAIPVEKGEGERLLSGLLHEWPVYLAYFISFMTIGAVWMEHSSLVDAIDHIDGVFMRLNLVLLLFCAFLPFPTRIMSEFAGDVAGERVAVVFYGLVLLMMTLMLLVMGRHAESEGLFGDDLEDERKEKARVKYQLLPGLIAYIVGGALGLLSPKLGIVIYLLIAIYLAIPIRDVTRLYRKRA
ncbi:MAG TPA: TMEM175 family protein [Thermoleophilia bacterium]|nr:TMEM175 family protein [Thermoleophilia bacterium]